MEITFKSDIDKARRKLSLIERKQLPFATSRALNETAYLTMQHARKMMKRLLHKPKPQTVRGVRYSKSTKRDLTATVFIDDGTHVVGRRWGGAYSTGLNVQRYLEPNIEGGNRGRKASERKLTANGVLPSGKYLTPAPRWTDARGNIRRGVSTRVLSQLSAFDDPGYDANITARSKKTAKYIQNAKFFVIPGKGIFTRRSKKIEAVFFFASQPTYEPRYPFERICRKHSRIKFNRVFPKHLEHAVRTAK